MKLFKTLFLGVLTIVATPLFANQMSSLQSNSEKTVIAIDMDDVMSIKQKPGFMDFIGLIKIVFRNPRVLTAFMHIKDIKKDGEKVSQELNGASNVVHAVLEKLKKDGYGDFSSYEDDIIERSTKPKPIASMVAAVEFLKAQGYLVIGATNHDWKQHLAYRKKMSQQGVDLNDLFDAVLVTRVNDIPVETGGQDQYSSFYKPIKNQNMYAAIAQSAYKPRDSYYTTLKKVAEEVANQKGLSVNNIIFTDDKKENVVAAKNNGINAIHFDLPGGSARKTSSEDLQKTVDSWKAQLAEHGVIVK